MELSEEDFEKLFEIFKIETDEHIQKLNSALVSLEETPDQMDLIEEIFREAHSLKGASRMMNFSSIETISHHMETILGRVKNSELKLTSEVNDLILKALDTVEAIVQTISEGGEENEQDASPLLRDLEKVSSGEVLDEITQDQVAQESNEAHLEEKTGMTKEDFEKLFEIFKIESDERIQKLNSALVSLEETPDQIDLIEEIFREAHSLKGASRMMSFSSIEAIFHHVETILDQVKNSELKLTSEVNDLILKALDTVETIIQTISEGGAENDIDTSALMTQLEHVSKGEIQVNKASESSHITDKTAPLENRERKVERDLDLFSQETRDAHKDLVYRLVEIGKNTNNLSDVKIAYEQAHALKGSARIVKHVAMGNLSFAMERLLYAILQESVPISSPIVSRLLEASDFILIFINQVEAKEASKIPSNFEKVISAINASVKPSEPSKVEEGRLSEKERPASPKITVGEKEASQNVTRVKRKIKIKPFSAGKTKSTVRVSAEKLDRLMDQAGEFLIMKLKASQRLDDIQSIINDYNAMSRDIKNKILQADKSNFSNNDYTDNKAGPQKTNFYELKRSFSFLSDRLDVLHKSLYDDFRQFSIIIEKLHDDVKKTRLFPFQTVIDTFPRMVRDISASVNKKVKLETSGVNIELDKYILEEIKDPMMHIVRNCIDHGIESPEERIRSGKPETGLITITVSHKGNNGVITVMDDGRGISIEKIKKSAIKNAIYTEKEIAQMQEKQILNLIFHPGFSTSEIITDISGRGIGMDVVKSNIEKLNGTIDIETKQSQGSTFTMVIPLTLSTTQSLKISVCGGTYFLPVYMVERIIKVSERALPIVEGFPAVHYAGSYIPYVRLESILGISDSESNGNGDTEKPVAILRSGDTLAAFSMDYFMGEEEILMKGLGPYMKRVRNISGVTIMRDGTIAPVLNVTDLINTVQLGDISPLRKKIEDKASNLELSILVVDDSVMTRTLEKNILESYGYRVSTAVDGQDALSKLQEKHFDIIVTDIQMPNLNGLEFTDQVKKDNRFKDIPVILVTALESDEDKKRGIEVGADAYIVKSSFDQSNLLSTIKRLV